MSRKLRELRCQIAEIVRIRKKGFFLWLLVVALGLSYQKPTSPILSISTFSANISCQTDDARCQVKPLGCFESLPELFVAEMVSEDMSPVRCFKHCDDISMLYASLHNGTTCYCGESLLGVATLQISASCNTPCPGHPWKSCGGSHSAQVYMVIKCQKGIRREVVEGCLSGKSSGAIRIEAKEWTNDACIMACEQEGFALAAVGDTCTCEHRHNIGRATKHGVCMNVTIYKTLSPDNFCESATLMEKGSMPRVALASFPGSGNTWFRQMLEKATGIFTGSVYDEELIFASGFIGEKVPANSGRTLIIKDHVVHAFSATMEYDAAILLIRDPYDAILAEYNRFRSLGHATSANQETLKTKEFRKFAIRKVETWRATYAKITQRVSRVIEVYFEDAVKNPILQIKRIIFFLGRHSKTIQNLTLTKRLKCLESDTEGKFKRPKRALKFDPFTPELKKKINEDIRKLRVELKDADVKTFPRYERQSFQTDNEISLN